MDIKLYYNPAYMITLQYIFCLITDAMSPELESELTAHPAQPQTAHQPMLNTTRARLEEFYTPHNERLAALLGDKYLWK